ncbi:MAG: secretin N-terminal domain-containing protein [Candidatus Omnitrophota bacterium]|nr:secretin N-terminal domain-containing protein [Candidatus Omnitrophota bacterium]
MIRRFLLIVMILGLLPGRIAGPPAFAATAQAQEKSRTISMDITGAYLEDVLKLLSRQAGMNFVASEGVREKKITLYFDGVPISDALNTILKANGLSITSHEGKNLFVVTESGASQIPTLTRIYQLKYARVVPTAGETAKSFGQSGSLIKETLQTTGTTAAGVGDVGTATGEGGVLAVIKSLLTEHGSVVPDPRTNSVIVTDIPERIRVIDETIARLDIKPKQIYIEAEVLEVTVDTLRRIGMEYGNTAGTVATWTGPVRTSFFPLSRGLLDGATETHTLGTFSLSSISALLKLLATEKDVKFLARPRLLTLSNEVAEIRIVSEAVTGITSSSQTDTGTITEEPERTTVGTILRVTPMVNDNKYVTMIIEPEVSRAIQSSSFTSFLDPTRRIARTTVMIADGGTAMIAGLISGEQTDASRRIPGLGDLPLIGLPFKRTETEKKNTEVLLFITPYIVEDETGTKKQFSKEREQAPLTTKEEQLLQGKRKRILKERAVIDNVDNILW